MINRIARIENLLQQEFNPFFLRLTDQSHLHSRHVEKMSFGSSSDATHLRLEIKADLLGSMPKIKSHRLIHKVLSDEFKTGLHALSIHIQN